MADNSAIRKMVRAGKFPEGRNPVMPLQKLDPRIPLSTGMVPKGYASDLSVIQGLKKPSGAVTTSPKGGISKNLGPTRGNSMTR